MLHHSPKQLEETGTNEFSLEKKGVNNVYSNQFGISGLPEICIILDMKSRSTSVASENAVTPIMPEFSFSGGKFFGCSHKASLMCAQLLNGLSGFWVCSRVNTVIMQAAGNKTKDFFSPQS